VGGVAGSESGPRDKARVRGDMREQQQEAKSVMQDGKNLVTQA